MFVFRQGCFYAAILQRCFVEGFIGAHGVIEIGFAGEFDGCMHGEHWHAAVDDFSTAFGEDVGDGAATAFVDFAELCHGTPAAENAWRSLARNSALASLEPLLPREPVYLQSATP